MNILIIFCHPSYDSFTKMVLDAFVSGLKKAGHKCEISDLYKINFKTDLSEEEYLREAYYRDDLLIPNDVLQEQNKINHSDVIVFIYPVFWTEAPAKLVGWFDRVWTYGFAYGDRKMKKLNKALFLCISGHTKENLDKFGHLTSMKTIMVGDRIYDRAKEVDFIVFDGMSRHDMNMRTQKMQQHLKKAYNIGLNL